MKTLTLTQPWATLVAIGVKRIETRSWRTDYRGPLAIHAAQGMPKQAKACCERADFHNRLDAAGFGARDGSDLPRGAVVAVCILQDVVPITGMDEAGHLKFVCPDIGGGLTLYEFGRGGWEPATIEEDVTSDKPFGDFAEGRFAWLLDGVAPLAEPVPAKGALGLWEWSGAH